MPVGAASRAEAEATWLDLHARLRGFVARRVADPHAADDLAQDILLRIHEHIDELRDEQRLDAWAYQVARRVIVDHYRARAGERETPGSDRLERLEGADPELEAGAAAGLEPDSQEVKAEIASCLLPMVERLPQPYREAIELTDLGELTQAEAAARLELSVPGMKARVQRGRQKLRQMLFDCCQVATDVRGTPTEVERRPAGGCGPGDSAAPCGC